MNNVTTNNRACTVVLSLALLAACGGGAAGNDAESGRPTLLSVDVGRVVDVYAYRRATASPTDAAAADRRDRLNRDLVLIERNVIVNPNVATEPLFDAAGNEVGRVLHVGTGMPRLGVFTVETCNGPRAYAGLVSSYFEQVTEDFDRLTDERWSQALTGVTPADPVWMSDLVSR